MNYISLDLNISEHKYKIQAEEVVMLLTEDIVLDIMKDYGEFPYKNNDKEIWFTTCCHCGDSHKLCYYKQSKMFYCYTNCGSMSIFNLLMKLYKNMTFIDALKYVANKVGLTGRKGIGIRKRTETAISDEELERLGKFATIRKRRSASVSDGSESDILSILPTPLTSDQAKILNYFDSNTFCGHWLDEGITVESMRKFNISWYGFRQSVVIPHLNENGELIGIRRRSYLEEDILYKRKYMPLIVEGIMYEHPLGLNLYGLYEHKHAILQRKQVVIVEAEKSVLLSDGYYHDKSIAVATCGFNITNAQAEMIMRCKVEEVILGFDKDFEPTDFEDIESYEDWTEAKKSKYKEYQSYIARIYSLAKRFINYCKVSVLWDNQHLLELKDSPYDKGKDIFEQLMKHRITLSTEDIMDKH